MAYEIVYWPGFTGRAEPAILMLEDLEEPYTIANDVADRISLLARTEPVFACPLLIEVPLCRWRCQTEWFKNVPRFAPPRSRRRAPRCGRVRDSLKAKKAVGNHVEVRASRSAIRR